MVKKLEELLPVDIPKELDGYRLFEYVVRIYDPSILEQGIAMSSGCVACNNGGGCNKGGGKVTEDYQDELSKDRI